MGLDMFLFGKKYHWTKWDDEKSQRMEDGYKVKDVSIELGYWRKHPNLHGYIVNIFAEGKDDCQGIELSAEDVLKLIEAVKAKALPETSGFFFGKSQMSDDEILEDLKILEGALTWLNTKDKDVSKSIVYEASW